MKTLATQQNNFFSDLILRVNVETGWSWHLEQWPPNSWHALTARDNCYEE